MSVYALSDQKSPDNWGISVISSEGTFAFLVEQYPEILGHLNASFLFFIKTLPQGLSIPYLYDVPIEKFGFFDFVNDHEYQTFQQLCVRAGLRNELDRLRLAVHNRDVTKLRIETSKKTRKIQDLFGFLSLIDNRNYRIHEAATDLEVAFSESSLDVGEYELQVITKFIQRAKNALLSDVF